MTTLLSPKALAKLADKEEIVILSIQLEMAREHNKTLTDIVIESEDTIKTMSHEIRRLNVEVELLKCQLGIS